MKLRFSHIRALTKWLGRCLPATLGVVLILAPAVAPAAEVLGQRWTNVLDRLQAAGISKVGDLDLGAFRQEAQQIQWKSIAGQPESVESGSRQSAFYSRDTRQVSISSQLPEAAAGSISQLELHEALGALGYRDHDYSLSTALTTLSTLPDKSQRDRVKKAYDNGLFKKENMRLKEGGTSVSGGGDLETLFVKTQALQLILAGGNVSDQFLLEYPYVNFEPIANKSYSQVYLNYEYVIHPARGARHENFSMFIPMSRWKKSEQRSSLIKEVARKITEIFPARPSAKTRTFQPESCGEGITATYPSTQDSAVASIQSTRASIQMGCRRFFDGEVSVSVLAPALESEATPQQAGNYYVDCQFIYGKSVVPYRSSARRGQSTVATMSIGLGSTGISATGSVALTREGRIAFTQLSLSDENNRTTALPSSKSTSGDNAISRTTVQGINLSYDCRKAAK